MEWAELLKPKRSGQNSSASQVDSDGRSEFKRDFDTVCNCTGLRRLQDKAQVFPLEREDYARTRLTHSIEAMSIAETLGVEAVSVIETKYSSCPKDTKKLIKDIPIILRVAALLHDMGNPPFGHLGEKIIADWFKVNLPKLRFLDSGKVVYSDTNPTDGKMVIHDLDPQMRQDFYHFEGNAQLLRLITKLSNVEDDYGMNLTYPVLATIIKYPTKSTEVPENKKNATILNKKMGYMYSENNIYKDINSELGLGGKRHPLVFLLEAADDIAYLTADIEDAHKKGIISLSDFLKVLNSNNRGDKLITDIIAKAHEYDGIEKDFPERDNCIMQKLLNYIKSKMISAVKAVFNENYESIMQGFFEEELLGCSEAKKISLVIRNKIEKVYIYYNRSITKTKLQSYQILNNLLNRFVSCVFNKKKVGESDDKDTLLYSMMSTNYRYVCEQNCENKDYNDAESIYYKLLLVTDSISGMTDTYAMDMYHLLMAI